MRSGLGAPAAGAAAAGLAGSCAKTISWPAASTAMKATAGRSRRRGMGLNGWKLGLAGEGLNPHSFQASISGWVQGVLRSANFFRAAATISVLTGEALLPKLLRT